MSCSRLPSDRPDIPDADADGVLRHPATEPEHGVLIRKARRWPGEDEAQRLRSDGTWVRDWWSGDAGWLQSPRPAPLRRPHPTTPWRQPQSRGHHARARPRHTSTLNNLLPHTISVVISLASWCYWMEQCGTNIFTQTLLIIFSNKNGFERWRSFYIVAGPRNSSRRYYSTFAHVKIPWRWNENLKNMMNRRGSS